MPPESVTPTGQICIALGNGLEGVLHGLKRLEDRKDGLDLGAHLLRGIVPEPLDYWLQVLLLSLGCK
jgi:hypothetical protein